MRIWATLVQTLASLLTAITGYFRDKRLIDLGAKEAELEGRKAQDEKIADIELAKSDDSVRVSTRKKYTRNKVDSL